MANEEQLSILKQGVDVWNKWRKENPHAEIDLSQADFKEMDLSESYLGGVNLDKADFTSARLVKVNFIQANLKETIFIKATLNEAQFHLANLTSANFQEANLSDADFEEAILEGASLYKADVSRACFWDAYLPGANLREANLRGADLWQATLREADLREANLSGAYLGEADLEEANLSGADLSEANLSNAILRRALFVQTKVEKAILSGSLVYAVNVWDLEGEFDEQKDLVINHRSILLDDEQPAITVDNIKVAQFIYMILNNEEIRDVINVLTSKSVLILGRFSIPERKAILNALRNKLREYNLLPIVFDFDRPTDKDFTETIKTLAGISYFVIADVTNPKSSPLELQAAVPDYQIPFVPIIQEGESPFAMMVDLQKKYDWVLNTVTYDSMETLIKVLKPLIIDPAMKKRQELRIIKAQEPEVISGKDFLDKGKE